MSVDDRLDVSDDVDEVEALRREMAALRDVVEKQQQTIEQQADAIEDLKKWKKDDKDLHNRRSRRIDDRFEEVYQVLDETVSVEEIESVEDELDAIRRLIGRKSDHLAQTDALLRKYIVTLAEEVDVDLLDSKVRGEDKLSRIVRFGPEDVIAGRVYPVHHRAACLLEHLDDYGSKRKDNGRRLVVLNGGDAGDCLERELGEDLGSTEIVRVFRQIENLAADSPRTVSVDTDCTPNELTVALDPEESGD
jgi:Txe/YoeB family toxin of Txe-Axe toxin-antitoxin module